MTVGELIVSTLTTATTPVVPDTETSTAVRYWTYRVSYVPIDFGDNTTDVFNCIVTLTYCCPLTDDALAVLVNSSNALVAAGFTRASMRDSTLGKPQQWTLDTQIVGVLDGTTIRV